MSQTSFPWLADVTQAAGAIPAWAAGALAALLVLLCIFEIARARTDGCSGGLGRVLFATIAAAGIIPLMIQNGIRERADTRRALEARVSEIAVRAMLPGSPLGCLSADAGTLIDNACEKMVFANAQTVASAVVYVGAQLSALEDAGRLERGADLANMASMRALRRALERDPFGITAHLLASRNGCTAERCEVFSLFSDTSVLKVNLREKVFDAYVKRHADDWKEQSTPVAKVQDGDQAAEAPVPQAENRPPTAAQRPPFVTQFDFPSAASIPPVSIMNPEPPTVAAASAAPDGAASDTASRAEQGTPATPVPPTRPQAQPGAPAARP